MSVQNNPEQASSVDASAPPKQCGCISEVSNMLREHNAALTTTMFARPERVIVSTYKIDSSKRGKIPHMLASFCPFCGASYGQ